MHRYAPRFKSIPLKQGLTFEPTWKTTPTMAFQRDLLNRCAGSDGKWSRFK